MTTLVRAAWALAESGPQADFAVAVEGERIAAAGAWPALRSQYPTAAVSGGADCVLLPAMVNSHDHGRGLGSLALGVGDDLLEIWLPRLGRQLAIRPYLAAAYDGLRLARAGVGLTAHSHNPHAWTALFDEAPDALRGYQDAGIRVAFHPPIIDQNTLIYDGREAFLTGLPDDLRPLARSFMGPIPLSQDEYLTGLAALWDGQRANPLVRIQVSPAGGQWCSDALITACVDFARQRGTRVQMHMLETRYQRAYAFRRWGKSFSTHLDEIGALGPWLTLAHMVWIEDDDLPLLAARGVGVAHNPGSNLRLRSGVAPVARMLAAGVQVGVGLDGHGLDDDQDYLRELRLAWTLANRPGAASPSVSAGQVWQMGTTTGAGITWDETLGRLAPGCAADLVLVDWDAVRGGWSPQGYPALEDFESFLLRRASREHVRDVMVNGAWIVRDGRSTRLDEAAVVAAMREDFERQWRDRHLDAQAEMLAARLLGEVRRFYAGWDDETP